MFSLSRTTTIAIIGMVLCLIGCVEPGSGADGYAAHGGDGGVESEGSAAETSSSELRGAETTTGYPHVGFITTEAVPQGCTATLLSPRVSVTAAHCVTGRTYGISYGGRDFTVDGTARFDPRSTAWPEDVAIVVHGSITGITPARLVAPPATGRDRLRVVGVGYDGSGAFIRPKRTSLFNLDGTVASWTGAGTLVISESTSDTRAVTLCSGDSGSPVFLASDSRALVGIVSNIRVESRPASGIVCGRSASAAQVGRGPVNTWLRAQLESRR